MDKDLYLESIKQDLSIQQNVLTTSISAVAVMDATTIRSLHFLNGGALFLLPAFVSALTSKAETALSSTDTVLIVMAGACFVLGNIATAISSWQSNWNYNHVARAAFDSTEFKLDMLNEVVMGTTSFPDLKQAEHKTATSRNEVQRSYFLGNVMLGIAWAAFTIGCYITGHVILT